MYVNRAPDPPPKRPCMRDMHELVHHVLTEPLIMLASLPELARRLDEITTRHPRFREEAPLVLAGEALRRERLAGVLLVVASAADYA